MTIEEKQQTLLICLTAAQVLHESLDDLADTRFYKHSLKQATKRLQIELTKVCDGEINKLFDMDEELMRDLQNGITQIGTQIVKSRNPTALVEFGKILEKRNW